MMVWILFCNSRWAMWWFKWVVEIFAISNNLCMNWIGSFTIQINALNALNNLNLAVHQIGTIRRRLTWFNMIPVHGWLDCCMNNTCLVTLHVSYFMIGWRVLSYIYVIFMLCYFILSHAMLWYFIKEDVAKMI